MSSDSCEDEEDLRILNYSKEETLLLVHFLIQPVNSSSLVEATRELSNFIQSFPFAAVLPVQPLKYLPTKDGGLALEFLRKKTSLKSAVDGGIRFFVLGRSDASKPSENFDNGNGNSDGLVIDARKENSYEQAYSVDLIAKRNSNGQTIPKVFSEKTITLALVADLMKRYGNGDDSRRFTGQSIMPDRIRVTSFYHKWM